MMLNGLTFDDVLLEPQFSDLKSRKEVDLTTQLGTIQLTTPIISANMDSVTEFKMAMEMARLGGLGILHRYATEEQIKQWVINCNLANALVVPSVGVKDGDKHLAEKLLETSKTKSVCIDIAHGDSLHTVEMVKFLKNLGYINIIAGNIATASAASRLAEAGANILKVGIGPGSVCTTRIVTGHGVPQLHAIEQCYNAVKHAENKVAIIADGGIRTSGDIVKALAAGADAVMIGGLLADTFEAPASKLGEYRGMASANAQKSFKGSVSNITPEGSARKIGKMLRPVSEIIEELNGGIRSGLSYSGARTIQELKKKAVFIKITGNSLVESHPHGTF